MHPRTSPSFPSKPQTSVSGKSRFRITSLTVIQGEEGKLGKRYNMRWVAAMVGEIAHSAADVFLSTPSTIATGVLAAN